MVVFSKNGHDNRRELVLLIMKRLNQNNLPPLQLLGLLIATGLIIVGVIFTDNFFRYYQDKFYPGVYVDNHLISGLTTQEARALLEQDVLPQDLQISVSVDETEISSSSAQLLISKNTDQVLNQAYLIGRSQNIFTNLVEITKHGFQSEKIASQTTFDLDKTTQLVTQLAKQTDIPGEEPYANLKTANQKDSLTIFPGKIGRQVEINQTVDQILDAPVSQQMKFSAITSPTGRHLSEEEVAQAKQRAQKFVGQQTTFVKEYQKIKLNDQQLVSLLAFPQGISDQQVQELLKEWKKEIDRPARNADFQVDEQTLKVTKFVPHLIGLEIDGQATKIQLQQIVAQIDQDQTISTEIELTTKQAEPEITLSKTNTLGINQLIGFGESYYYHSIPSRIHNVKITAERISDVIVPPGEEFSFNQTLGEVASTTGYQPAYIIKEGKTVLGDGGGVCQVSSTLFRALLDAGLNITRRLPHSYRVSYYELNSDPGFDATVYSGNVDLRFINDTSKHLLIHTQTDSNKLYMNVEIYGTDDGRTVKISNYRKWDQRPPATTVYFDDPSLPSGKLKQIDWSAPGIKAEFNWQVTDKEGKIIHEKKFYSNYIPWSAKYLRGTKAD